MLVLPLRSTNVKPILSRLLNFVNMNSDGLGRIGGRIRRELLGKIIFFASANGNGNVHNMESLMYSEFIENMDENNNISSMTIINKIVQDVCF